MMLERYSFLTRARYSVKQISLRLKLVLLLCFLRMTIRLIYSILQTSTNLLPHGALESLSNLSLKNKDLLEKLYDMLEIMAWVSDDSCKLLCQMHVAFI